MISFPSFFKMLSFQIRPLWGTISSLVIALYFATPAAAQDAVGLTVNQTLEKNLSGAVEHHYRLTAAADQFFRIQVEQRGVNVGLKLSAPDGKTLLEQDTTDAGESETAMWIAPAAGDYRIIISTEEKSARGSYQIKFTDLRVATDQDRLRFTAQTEFLEAEKLAADNKAESKRQAIPKYEQAAKLWQQAEEKSLAALALDFAGNTYRALREFPAAIERYTWALALNRETGRRSAEGNALQAIGEAYFLANQKDKAIEPFKQALAVRQAIGEREGMATTLNNLGATYNDLGDRLQARQYYEQALPLRRELKDKRGEAVTLNGLGEAYRQSGEQRKALKFFEQALALRREVRDRAGEGVTLNGLGAIYSDLGEMQKALDAYNQALALRRAARDKAGEALTLINIGRAYDVLGAPQEALKNYEPALQIAREAKARRVESQTLNFMGLAYWANGEYPKALYAYEESLKIRRELQDKGGEAETLNNTGLVYDSLGERRKAIETFNQVLPIVRSLGNRQSEARLLGNLGFAHAALGEQQQALDYFRQGVELSRAVGDRQREAKIRYGMARVESARNRLKPAREQIEQAIKIIETLRAKLISPDLRAEYRASVQQYYDLYIDVLMRLGKRLPKSGLTSTALQVSEQARARSLVELLTEASADIRQGVEASLVERERELQDQLNDRTTAQIRLLGSRAKAEQIAEVGKEIDQLNRDLRDTQARIRASSPHYANLTQPQPLAPRQIQALLDANTMLLEFSLGEERSYLWAVTPTTIRSFTLPKRAVIEATAKRFYELITARNQFVAKESNQQKQNRVAAADAESPVAAAELGRMLLSQVAPLLGKKRLIVVADGALQYVPFSALSIAPAKARHQPLVASNEVLFLPSATTLAVLRSEAVSREKAAKTVAVIADPVFEAKDERIKVVKIGADKDATAKPPQVQPTPLAAETEPSRILLYKSGKESGAVDAEFRIPRLPNTRREAETILSLASDNAGKAVFDFAASRAAATGEDLGQYRILHFATHGFLNSLNPELSGLVLSLVDEQGKLQNGYLLAPEIYNLKLPATELVVLSACQTGLGREVRGEGIVGLTRGFMYAGAPRVVVSLWSVNDRSTADLMKSFYEAMLAKGQRPAAALRSAQLQLRQLKQWQSPYFWAAFGLQGEWR